MRKILLILMLPLLAACSGDNEDDGSGNTTDVAVTGTVEKVGMSYAVVNGYVNLNHITTDNKTEVGIEYANYSYRDGEGYRQKTKSLTGNKISIKLSDAIWPDETFYYRTYVKTGTFTHYGQMRQFTTQKGSGVATTGAASNITESTAVLSGTAKLDDIPQDENVSVGIAYSIKKEDFVDTPSLLDYSFDAIDFGFAFAGYKSSFSLDIKDLRPLTHYYYSAFTRIGVKFYFAEIKEFTTKSSQ